MLRYFFLACLLLLAACQRSPSEPAPPPPLRDEPAQAAKAAPPPAPAATSGAYRLPGAERVVAIGDVHGDLSSTREALRLASAIDAQDRWIGKTLTVVQVGDQLDRGDDEPEILALFERLEAEAERAGGRLIVLNGNHEIMNVAGDLRYVTSEGFSDFEKSDAAQHAAREARRAAFAPGAEYGKKLARRKTVVAVGDTLFVHAGVLPKHVEYGLDRINDEVSRWMRGERSAPEIVMAEDAPVWTRLYGGAEPTTAACATLERMLGSLGLRRLVVGHTVQEGGITAACGGKVQRVDVGLSDYYGKNPTQVLEITGAGTRVLTAGAAPP